MENITVNEKRRVKFNVVDAMIIIASIILIGAILVFTDPFGWFDFSNSSRVTLQYIVEFKAVDNDVKNHINIGESAWIASGNQEMGSIAGIESFRAYSWESDEEGGVMVKKPMAGKNDVYVTIKAPCVYVDGVGYFVNGKQIAVGSLLELRFASFSGSGYCVGFEVVDGEGDGV